LEKKDDRQHDRSKHSHFLNVRDGNLLGDALHIVTKPDNQRSKCQESNHGGDERELHARIVERHRLGMVGAKPAVCHVIDRDIDKRHDGQRGGQDRSGAGFR
jgi:hypothetical protein